MDRVTLMLEGQATRIGCLLNPESLVTRRSAGVVTSRALGGLAESSADLPLLYSGRGRTEYDLRLFFDTSLGLGSSESSPDVRRQTAPIWDLSELNRDALGALAAPRVRLIWGKAWNLLGVVEAVAERLEHFTSSGVPRRSFLSLRLVRVPDPALAPEAEPEVLPPATLVEEDLGPLLEAQPREPLEAPRLMPNDGGNLQLASERAYGSPRFWRVLARANNLLPSDFGNATRPLVAPSSAQIEGALS